MKITWDDCVYGCLGQVIAEDGQTLVVQLDYDAPGIAEAFGWSTTDLQLCRKCRKELPETDEDCDDEDIKCEECGRKKGNSVCDHSSTDGTVDCKECGITANQFIVAALNFLHENDGETADDPGYFERN